jgi:hypothetical protein
MYDFSIWGALQYCVCKTGFSDLADFAKYTAGLNSGPLQHVEKEYIIL